MLCRVRSLHFPVRHHGMDHNNDHDRAHGKDHDKIHGKGTARTQQEHSKDTGMTTTRVMKRNTAKITTQILRTTRTTATTLNTSCQSDQPNTKDRLGRDGGDANPAPTRRRPGAIT